MGWLRGYLNPKSKAKTAGLTGYTHYPDIAWPVVTAAWCTIFSLELMTQGKSTFGHLETTVQPDKFDAECGSVASYEPHRATPPRGRKQNPQNRKPAPAKGRGCVVANN